MPALPVRPYTCVKGCRVGVCWRGRPLASRMCCVMYDRNSDLILCFSMLLTV